MSTRHLPSQTRSNQSIPNNPRSYGVEDIRYYIDGFILHHKSQRHAPVTIVNHRERLGRFVWFLEQNGYPTELSAITPNHIRHFLTYLTETNEGRWGSTKGRANSPLTPNSIHTYARNLKAFFRWAAKEADLPRNLFENIQMPTLPNQWRVQVFNDEEIEALFAAVERMGDPFIVQAETARVLREAREALAESEALTNRILKRQGK
jgi:site-specific recombinase XerD